MKKETEEKLATSLTAETTELIPFLPYLLQDFWELGSDPEAMARLIKKHAELSENTRVLDLACGKGAVSVKLAHKLGVKVKGIDILSEFIEYAKQKAKEFNVGGLCEFVVGDINEAVETERGYDCVILGATGCSIFGSPLKTLLKLRTVIKNGGYILIDESYLPDCGKKDEVKTNYDFLTEKQWRALFIEAGLELIETDFEKGWENLDSSEGMEFITNRANQLIEKHPDKKILFEGYVKSQQNEYDDLDNNLMSVTWILRSVI